MGVYIVLLSLVIVLGLLQYFFFSENKIVKAIYLVIVGIAMIYIVGNRYGIGFDYYTYIDLQVQIAGMNFQELMNYPMEPGFMIFAKLVSMISINPHALYYATAIVVVGIACYLYFRYSAIPAVSMLFFMVLNFYYNSMNLIRYALATAIVMLLYGFIIKCKFDYTKENMKWSVLKKDLLTNFLPYLLIALLAASFHKSALIMLPIYFIVKIPLTWKTGIVYGVGTIVATAVARPVTYFLSDLFFNGNYSELNLYTDAGGYGYILVPALICIFIGLCFTRLIKKFPQSLPLLNLTIYSFGLYFISAFSVFIFTRLTYYTFVFVTFLLPMAIQSLKSDPEEVKEFNQLNEQLEDPELPKEEYRELYKKKKRFEEKHKDEKAYYVSAIVFVFLLGLGVQYRGYSGGDHKVYPYRSMSNSVNMFTNGIDSSDRKIRANYLNISGQSDFGWYLNAAQDPNYIIILASQGDILAQNSPNAAQYTYSRLEALEYFGLDTRALDANGQTYVAIGQNGTAYFNEVSDDVIKTEVEIDGHTIVVASSPKSKGSYSSIKIDGEEHSAQKEGLNIVIFDTVTGEVVSESNFN